MTDIEFEGRIEEAAHKTWNHIRPECIKCADECGETLGRDDVVGEVLDHIDAYGEDEEVAYKLLNMDMNEAYKILRGVFRSTKY